MTRSHVVLCYGKAYLLYLSLFSLSVLLFVVPSSTVTLKKNEFAERSKKKSFYLAIAQNNMTCQQGLVKAVDQYVM